MSTIKNLLELEANKVSRDIKDYSMLLTAPSSFGKSPFLVELYGDRAILLGFENSHKGIAGCHAVGVDSYSTLMAYITQLENPLVREKYDVVIIDTLFLLDFLCEKSITDSYGKDLLGDCLIYNKAYKIVDKKFLAIIKRLQRMNYTMVYVCHPLEVKTKNLEGQDIVKYEPKVSERIKSLLIPEIDIRLFGGFDNEGNKVLYTQSTQHFEARIRVGDVIPVIPFTVEDLKNEFALGIDRRIKNKELIVDNIEHKNVESVKQRELVDVMNDISEVGQSLKADKERLKKAETIIFKELGLDNDGKQRTLAEATPSMIPTLEAILVQIKAL